MTIKRVFPAVAVLAAASTVAAFAAEKDVIDKTFTVTPGGNLVMRVDRGAIHVTSGNSDKVEVKVVRELKRGSDSEAEEIYAQHKIDISQDGNTITVEADNPNKSGGFFHKNPFNNLRVDYTISIPHSFNLNLNTSGGNIEIADVQGEVKTHTSGGNIKLGTIDGPIDSHTSGGTITLKSGHGKATLRTSGGDLRIGDVDGDVIARTSGGNITLGSVKGSSDAQTSGGSIKVNNAFGPVSARTSGGNVSARLSVQPKGDCALKTSGGNVSVTLADNLAVDVNAQTSGGSIHSDFPGDLNKQKTRLVAQINGGGPGLVLQTSGGNVDIRKE
jgi:DUF4097 and DUF4098 domain-containing protein YvlB